MTVTKKTKRPPRPQPAPAVDHRATLARRLDLLADAELQHGHVAAAELLAHRAAQLREARA